ncbi:hypothetical protein U0070_004473, partial [Myodes glareolus]
MKIRWISELNILHCDQPTDDPLASGLDKSENEIVAIYGLRDIVTYLTKRTVVIYQKAMQDAEFNWSDMGEVILIRGGVFTKLIHRNKTLTSKKSQTLSVVAEEQNK